MGIASLDLFGEEIKLRVKNSEKVKTTFGGFLTIILCISMVTFCWLIGNDIIYREKPVSYKDIIVTTSYPQLALDKYDFPIGFALQDQNGNIVPMNSSLVELTVRQTFTDQVKNIITKKQFPLVACDHSHFPNQTDISLINNYLCVDNQNFTVGGYWSESSLTYLNINVALCNYNNTPDKCGTYDEMMKYISEFQLNLGLLFYLQTLSVSNYTNPFINYPSTPYKFLYPQGTKIVNYMVQSNILNTDSGFFSQSFDQIEYFSFSELQSDLSVNFGTSIMSMDIYSSNISDRTYRKYVKITDILGSIGGILNFLMVVFYFISLPFAKIQKYISIIEKLHAQDVRLEEGSTQVLRINAKSYNSSIVVVSSTNILTGNTVKQFDSPSRKITKGFIQDKVLKFKIPKFEMRKISKYKIMEWCHVKLKGRSSLEYKNFKKVQHALI